MLASLDNSFVAGANRLAGRLQQEMGFTMPAILRQAATATIMATFLAVAATWLMRDFVFVAITMFFAVITVSAFWKLLMRYSRDADRDWTSDLARDYAVRAIGATEGQRRIREIGLGFSMVSLLLTFSIMQFRALDLVDLTMIALIVSTMGHMYLSCAEPKPPGTRRREAKLAFAGGRG